jgi:type I restriction enzyme S subunit
MMAAPRRTSCLSWLRALCRTPKPSWRRAATQEFDAVIGSTFREIALIQEFRTRLIADAVTGKLDVRAAAASLPAITELEPIDDLADGDDLDEAVDDPENEEVAA